MKRTQSGMTLVGFIIVLAVVGVFVYTGMKVVPMYSEYYSVKKSFADMAKDGGVAGYDAYKIRDLISRRFDTGYVENVEPKDVKITRNDNGVRLELDYEVRKPLIANLDIVGNFSVDQQIRRDGTE